MLRFVALRLLQMIPVLLVIAMLTFFMIRLAPGGPFSAERNAPPEIRKNLEAYYGFDLPVYRQFLRWLRQRSARRPRSFLSLRQSLGQRVDRGIVSHFGRAHLLVAARRHHHRRDRRVDRFPSSQHALSITSRVLSPWPASPCRTSCSVRCWFSSLRSILVWTRVSGWDEPTDRVLPSLTLGTRSMPPISRGSRAAACWRFFRRISSAPRALKAPPMFASFCKHALRGGFMPVVSYLGPPSPALLTGSFVIETIFQIPGLGRYFVNAAFNRDYTLVLGAVIFYAALIVVFNLIVDVVLVWMNPKIEIRMSLGPRSPARCRASGSRPSSEAGLSLWRDAWHRLAKNKWPWPAGSFSVLGSSLAAPSGRSFSSNPMPDTESRARRASPPSADTLARHRHAWDAICLCAFSMAGGLPRGRALRHRRRSHHRRDLRRHLRIFRRQARRRHDAHRGHHVCAAVHRFRHSADGLLRAELCPAVRRHRRGRMAHHGAHRPRPGDVAATTWSSSRPPMRSGLRQAAHHLSPHDPQRSRADHRLHHADRSGGHAARGVPQFSRARRAAAHEFVGRADQGRRGQHGRIPVAADLSRARCSRSRFSRSTSSATACATRSIRGRPKIDAMPLLEVENLRTYFHTRNGSCARGRRRFVLPRTGRNARHRRRIRLGQIRHLLFADGSHPAAARAASKAARAMFDGIDLLIAPDARTRARFAANASR